MLISHFSKKFVNIILGGDINIDVLKNNPNHKLLKRTLKVHKMRYLVNFPTRVTEESESAIDNFIIKNCHDCKVIVEGIVTCLSDHNGQLLLIKNKNLNNTKEVQSTIKRTTRNFNIQNLNLFKNLLETEIWESVYMAPVERK